MKYSPLKSVDKMHKSFGVPAQATMSNFDARMLRANLILEESFEAIDALGFKPVYNFHKNEYYLAEIPFDEWTHPQPREELAKELADVLVVTYGTAATFGIPLQEVFNEVMRSNMSKLGDDGKPVFRDDGKFLKGPNYVKADVHGAMTGEWL